MSNENEVKFGDIATVKIGRNEIDVEVMEILPDGYRVKSSSSNKEFKVRKIERGIVPQQQTDAPPANTKKTSLLDAAVIVLTASPEPLNTREIIAKAIEQGLWSPTGAKTPEQTLYGAIFREIATKERPRIVKSDCKGKFELNLD